MTISRKLFEVLGDDELRQACMGPIVEQIRGKSPAVKSQALAELNPSQQALFMYGVWFDHAKQSPMELYCWTAQMLSQPGYWEGVTKALKYFENEAMSVILEELRVLLDIHVLQKGRDLSEVTFKDLEQQEDLNEQVQECYRSFQAEVPCSMHRLAQYIRANAEDFITFLPEAENRND
ncbi:hypothetical protein [Paenibacillus lupini]|uniref:hypothetical protein n=1 Tax=Paenibacillus lupini TaxID=1450204 RepID=UPI00141F840C|nr:hypothetical protein [Paenibacillus lupini]NIK25885.1 hypothetical protein [Paenibacillus lupini]